MNDLDEELALQATSLSKRYRLGNLHSLNRTMRLILRRAPAANSGEFDALRGVDISVRRGETIGIVGTNGSGKSTFLQILAGTTLPTGGELLVRGRVLPLLAVGLAFHPELTGRENVVLFATSVGIPPQTAREQMDQVIDFSGVGAHIDTPVKRYSSGMVSRLSVAVAFQFPADIYVFDEVLAVVDAEFQERCIEQIQRLDEEGRTIFFVSHHAAQVTAVCDRVLWLEKGLVRAFGPAAETLAAYEDAHHVLHRTATG